jgi:ABC-type multidrug transport system ATPase subunit
MVNADRTVVATMHQLSALVFQLFDTLLLLSKGRVIFFGPVGNSVKFFVSSPFEFNFGNYHNPAEFLSDISGGLLLDGKVLLLVGSFYCY